MLFRVLFSYRDDREVEQCWTYSLAAVGVCSLQFTFSFLATFNPGEGVCCCRGCDFQIPTEKGLKVPEPECISESIRKRC